MERWGARREAGSFPAPPNAGIWGVLAGFEGICAEESKSLCS